MKKVLYSNCYLLFLHCYLLKALASSLLYEKFLSVMSHPLVHVEGRVISLSKIAMC